MPTLRENSKLDLVIYQINRVLGASPIVNYRVVDNDRSEVVAEFDVEVPGFEDRDNSLTYEDIVRKADRMIIDQLDRLRRDIVQT